MKSVTFESSKLKNEIDLGNVVSFPTETVYGFGIRWDDSQAFLKLASVKQRAINKPVSIMCGTKFPLKEYFEINHKIQKIIDRYLPGPLTILLKAKANVPWQTHLGTNIVGIRIPKFDKLLKKECKMSDKIIKFLVYEGRISVICANTTEMVEEARKIHDMSPVVTAAFGRLLTITSIMATEMKGSKDKLTVQLKGNGPIGVMIATANNKPMVKGYVTNPVVELPLNEDGKLDVSGAVGYEGYINVVKDIGLKDPYIGISPLVSGEIAEDFANYFVHSEQRNSAVALGVLVDKNGVRASGGYLINPMPDATEEDISKVEQAIFKAGAMSKMLDQNLTLEEIAKRITGDENVEIIEDSIKPEFKCDCSKEHMEDALMTIGKKELEDIIEKEGKAELVCHFCNKNYQFDKEELENIVRRIEQEKE